jgi:hypothetical protein
MSVVSDLQRGVAKAWKTLNGVPTSALPVGLIFGAVGSVVLIRRGGGWTIDFAAGYLDPASVATAFAWLAVASVVVLGILRGAGLRSNAPAVRVGGKLVLDCWLFPLGLLLGLIPAGSVVEHLGQVATLGAVCAGVGTILMLVLFDRLFSKR